jgi:hypothetical protein
MHIVISDYRPKADCQLSGKKDCECFVIQSPAIGEGAAVVSPAELLKLVRLYHRMETDGTTTTACDSRSSHWGASKTHSVGSSVSVSDSLSSSQNQ